MRFLLPILLCLSCFAQPNPINRRAVAIAGLASVASIPDPSQISGHLYRWWVSTDVAANVTMSNQWNDRIVSQRMYQMDTSVAPTNGPAGARFSGTQSLTNIVVGYDVGNITGCGGCDTLFFVFTPDGAAGEEQLLTDVTRANRGPGMNGTNLRYTGGISGGPNTICPLAAGSTNDVIVLFTSTNTTWYTNGVAAKTNTTVNVDDFSFGRIGIGSLGFYKGSLFEVGVYTNYLAPQADVTALHKFWTNSHKYSP